MLGNMLNDLAKAIRRWTEKNDWFDDHTEVSVEQQIEPYFEFFATFASQVAQHRCFLVAS